MQSRAARLRRIQERVARGMKGPQFSVDAFLADRRGQAQSDDAMAESVGDAPSVAAPLASKNRGEDHG
ncbi:MAG TPA: hypothetical protein VL244_01995 [Alphaproteobacteria bacterium]|nr:hypothetical protein [Alphaproteobacteria bacterium]